MFIQYQNAFLYEYNISSHKLSLHDSLFFINESLDFKITKMDCQKCLIYANRPSSYCSYYSLILTFGGSSIQNSWASALAAATRIVRALKWYIWSLDGALIRAFECLNLATEYNKA